ncbi:hypothetical protein [Fluviispira multicolorata]|uniref:Outer membrane protein beta-barrel domain-containing protein n=1 Tax=Fluviispira multicolorata TaxID=2654512 RepID=A0A833JDZ8_9BACT|nr:hypothetical protein [Fluviispira multicolorata]KAB8029175.1 hypothetical protein GCL57_11605 [Fluviispira multicolorata]
MRKLLKIFIFIFLMSFLTNIFPQEDPTIPISQRYLNNPLINDTTRNPISYENPFIDSKGSNKIQNDNLKPTDGVKPEKNIITEPKNPPAEIVKKVEPAKDEKKESKSTESTEKKDDSKPSEDDGLFGPIRFGPMVGFGILMGPNISIESKFFKYIGLSFSYGGYNNLNLFISPQLKSLLNNQSDSFSIDTLKMTYRQYEAKLSIFPFGSSFFIGIAYGQRNITLKANATIIATITGLPSKLTTPVEEEINISSVYLTPQLGWLATWGGKFGWFAIGTEFGLQYSLKNTVNLKTTFTDPAAIPYLSLLTTTPEYLALYSQLQTSLTDNLNKYPLPYWNILKIGWLF